MCAGRPARQCRDRSIDLIKTLAIACVLLIHASSGGFWSPFASADWLCTLFWSTASRAAVPLFLMCSGALFLNPRRELPLGKLYGRYWLRILTALIVWGACYKLIEIARTGAVTMQALADGALQLLRLEDETHLYYLRIMLVFYAFVPIGRLIVRHASRRDLQYLLLLWLALGILAPTLAGNWPSAPLAVPGQWPLNTTYTALGYGLLGYYLTAWPPERAAVGILSAAGGFLFVFGATLWASLRQGALYNGFLEGKTLGVFLQAAGLFVLARRVQVPDRLAAGLETVSNASFCIYLAHMAFLHLFTDLGWTVRLAPCILSIPLTAAAAFGCSVLVWALLRRVPWVRSWLI